MPATNTSVALGDHFARFVAEQVDTGRYATTSEVIRAGLRLLEQNEQHVEALLQALREGVESGFVEDFDPDEFLAEMHRKHGA